MSYSLKDYPNNGIPIGTFLLHFFYYYAGTMMKSGGLNINVDGRNANEMKEHLFAVTPYLKGLCI